MALTAVMAAVLATTALPAAARDGNVKVLYGQPADPETSVVLNEGGTGITVVRGSSTFVPARFTAGEPLAYISGEAIRLDSLEPASDWFVARSDGRLVVVHCYSQQSVYVGGGRRIFCDARKF